MSDTRIQDAREVVFRALCLGAVLKRGEYEITVQTLDDYSLPEDVRHRIIAKHHDLNDQLQQWIIDENLAPHLTEAERTLLEKPLATWSDRSMITTSWRIESLGVMLWALEVLDSIPGYDTQFEPEDVLCPLEVLEPTIDLVWRAALRPAEELRKARDEAELWNWRSRAMELQRMGVRPPEGVTFREIVRLTAEKAVASGRLPYLIDDDFPAFGQPYAQLNEDQYRLTSAIAYERYFALNWMCELSSEWENIRIDR